MNDQTQPPDGSAAQAGQAQARGYDDSNGRPRPDPVLTRRFRALEEALHGSTSRSRAQALNWSGVDETSVAFDSIAKDLEASIPGDRPTSDLPPTSSGKKQGG